MHKFQILKLKCKAIRLYLDIEHQNSGMWQTICEQIADLRHLYRICRFARPLSANVVSIARGPTQKP